MSPMSSDGEPPRRALNPATVLFRSMPKECRLTSADRSAVRAFAYRLSDEVATGAGFVCLISNDRVLQRLNREFLDHDYATDVLSFPDRSPNGDLGEMAISIGRAAAQAEEFGHSALEELCILMLHGLLHLNGFDHERDNGQMARAERKWRKHFGLPEGLIARSRAPRQKRTRRTTGRSAGRA